MKTKLTAIHTNITTLLVDVIGNAANSSLLGGGGGGQLLSPIYRYPIAHAASVAVEGVKDCVKVDCFSEINFCCFSADDLLCYHDILSDG